MAIPMDLQRFGHVVDKGIDFAEQESLEVGAPRRPLFRPEIVQGFAYRQEKRLEHNDEFTSARTAHDNTREQGVKLFATFKQFFGGAKLSSSSRHAVARQLDSRCISMRYQVLTSSLRSNPSGFLTEEARQRIGDIESAHERREDTTDRMNLFFEEFGTHYVDGFNAGGELFLHLQEASFDENECSTRHREAKLGFAELCQVNAQNDNRNSSVRQDWSRGLQVSVVGGSSVALVPDDAPAWLRGVEVGNAAVLECFIRPVSDLFQGQSKTLMLQRAEHRIFQSRYQHSLDALQLVMQRSFLGMDNLLNQDQQPLQDVLKAMNCTGCDSVKTSHELMTELTALRQRFLEVTQTEADPNEQLAELLAPSGAYGGQLAALKDLIQRFKRVASNVRILQNTGASFKRASPCAHLCWGPAARNRALVQADALLKLLELCITKVQQQLVTNPPRFRPHFNGMKNRMMVGATNVGKGSLLTAVLDRVYGPAPVGSADRPLVEAHETVGDVKSFQLTERIWAHDPWGYGTRTHPLDLAYFAQLGLPKMDLVAVLSLASSPENSSSITPLLAALRNHNVRYCVVLTQADAVFQPGEDQEVTLRGKVARWREVVPNAEIFVVSVHPRFQGDHWNQVESFLEWFLHD
jgi:GTP-binding protein EngB required for normal cell division